eukprot:630930-Pelagomonas_calceolata.AAC.4
MKCPKCSFNDIAQHGVAEVTNVTASTRNLFSGPHRMRDLAGAVLAWQHRHWTGETLQKCLTASCMAGSSPRLGHGVHPPLK